MKKKMLLFFAMVLMILVGCGNHQILDTTYSYDKAIIQLVNGEIVECEIKTWTDYEGEQIQIEIS